jgi:MYXO-CTERM domain-containing protein
LTGNPFVENAGGWSSVAHVQGISGNDCSGWIVSGTGGGADGGSPCTHIVPEPAGHGVFGLGVLLVGLFVGLRRRWV